MSDGELAVEAATAGARVVRAAYGEPVERFAKSSTDFATPTDLEAEQSIVDVLGAARPDDAVLAEERGPVGEADRTWLVDPLCGTLNFAATTPLLAVNVALREPGGVLVAAVADPLAEEVFWTDGTAVWVRAGGSDVAVGPSAASRLVDVDLGLDHEHPGPGRFRPATLLGDPVFRARFGPRVLSTTLALTWVAAGRRAAYLADGDMRDNVHFAAGIALCRAAGCVVTDLAGDPVGTGPTGLIAAADEETHATLLGLVAAAR